MHASLTFSQAVFAGARRPIPCVGRAQRKQPYGRAWDAFIAAALSTRSRSPVYLCAHLLAFYTSVHKYM